MPIHEYWCTDCQRLWEDLTLKASDVKDVVNCPVCKKECRKIMSRPSFRFGKLMTPGGPTIHDKDGHESLGMTGEQAEKSEKEQRDMRQHVESGGDPNDIIFGKGSEVD